MAISMDDVGKLTEPHPQITKINNFSSIDLTAYMAPEFIKRDYIIEGCESKMDYFSVGCVLLEMLTGKPPKTQKKTAQWKSPRVSWLMGKKLKLVLRGLLHKIPTARYGYDHVITSDWLYDVRCYIQIFVSIILYIPFDYYIYILFYYHYI